MRKYIARFRRKQFAVYLLIEELNYWVPWGARYRTHENAVEQSKWMDSLFFQTQIRRVR